jgi:hypothetical protein
MVKTALLESAVVPLLTLTFAVAVGVLGTVQAYTPDDALTPVAMVVHAVPGAVLYERSTVVSDVDVHVIFCAVPACQLSPPLGARTVTEAGGGRELTLKSSSRNAVGVLTISCNAKYDWDGWYDASTA